MSSLYFRLLCLLWRACWSKARAGLPALTGRVGLWFRAWPLDCDLNWHVNNARYLSFMDLGRVAWMIEQGILSKVWQARWTVVAQAVEISYVRPILPWQRFRVDTELLGWDEKYWYMEQRFLVKGHLVAWAMVRGVFLERGKPVPPQKMLAWAGLEGPAPELPERVRLWQQFLQHKRQHGRQQAGNPLL